MSRRPIARFRRVQRADQLYDRFRRGLRPRIELLEPRLAMDGALPILTADAFSLRTNSDPVRIDILANDLWQDYAGPRRITSLSFPSSGGTAEVAADGQAIVFRPAGDFAGDETFTYFIDDQFSAEVTVRVLSPLTADFVTIDAGGEQQRLDVLANDPFGPGYTGPRRITSVSATQFGGTVTISADGQSLLYQAPDDPDVLGQTDHITYIVDGKYPADVSVLVSNPLQDDFTEILQNAGPTTLLPLANDPFWSGYAGARVITSVRSSTGGEATIGADGREIIYRPNDDHWGGETITYIVDRKFAATYHVNVLRPAQDDDFALDQADPGTVFAVLDNDYVQYNGVAAQKIVQRITSVGPTEQGGTVEITADGQSIRYVPRPDFVGTDRFVYRADGKYPASVSVRVSRPVRDDGFFGIPENNQQVRPHDSVMAESVDNLLPVLSNDFIRAGQHAVTAVAAPSQGGSVAIAADGSGIVYSPRPGFEGVDEFTYTVDGEWSATVRVLVRSPVVDSTFALDPVQGQVYEFEVAPNIVGAGRYTGPGIVTSVEITSGDGVSAIAPNGRSISYAPGSFAYARISYTVDGKYTAHIAAWFKNSAYLFDDVRAVDQNQSTTIDVQANDPFRGYEYNGTHWVLLEYTGARVTTGVYGAQHGTVSLAADGKSVVYRPVDDYVGEDRFSYLVDGRQLMSATVHVVRRVRDDEFRVAPDSQGNVLPVLVNDLLAGGYAGAGTITGVTPPPSGAQISISADGRSLIYTPAAGFAGTDEVTYLVDGHLKAHVQIKVASLQENVYPRFDSLAELQDWLIANAVAAYQSQFGREVSWWEPGSRSWYYRSPITTSNVGDYLMSVAADRGHSNTNVQIAGVDEADLSETDSTYLYVLSRGKLVVSQAWPAESLSVVSQTPIDGTPIGLYLSGDRLTVVARTSRQAAAGWSSTGEAETTVTILDVSDRSQPRVLRSIALDGTYATSRAIGDFVYLQLQSASGLRLPGPEFRPDDPPPTDGGPPSGRLVRGHYETQDEYVQRIREHFGELLERMLPHFRTYGPDGSLLRSGLLVTPEEIGRPRDDSDQSLLSVVSINRAAAQPDVASSTAILTGGSDQVIMNHHSLYLFHPERSEEDGLVTGIVKFDIDETTGHVAPVARGQVAGTLLNQFSADEQHDDLRLATTLRNNSSGNWSNVAQNDVWVLRQDGDLLEPIGSLQNLAPGESIRSVRYLGTRAVVTTFPTQSVGVDPMYVVDLANPQQPRVLGAVTLPGFSQYMQFIDATHVLAVGLSVPTRQGPAGNWRWHGTGGDYQVLAASPHVPAGYWVWEPVGGAPAQISLFDVSDLAHPHLLDQLTLSHFSQSLAQDDHHAFGWFEEHGLLALPISRTYPQRVDLDGDGYKEATVTSHADQVQYFRIHTDEGGTRAVELAGTVDLTSAAMRTAFIDQVLLAIGDGQIVATAVASPGDVLAEVSWAPPISPVFAGGGGGLLIDGASAAATFRGGPMARWTTPLVSLPSDAGSPALRQTEQFVAMARNDLAGRLGISSAAPLLVAVETAQASAAGRAMLVLRVGDQQFLYSLADDGSIELIGASRHNAGLAGDADGDGLVTPRDALWVINHLNRSIVGGSSGATVLRQIVPSAAIDSSPGFLDVNGDGICTPLDVLSIVNELNPLAAIADPTVPTPTAIATALTEVAAELAEAATPGGRWAAVGSRSQNAAAFDVPAATTQPSPGDSQPWTVDEDLLSVLTSRRRLRVG